MGIIEAGIKTAKAAAKAAEELKTLERAAAHTAAHQSLEGMEAAAKGRLIIPDTVAAERTAAKQTESTARRLTEAKAKEDLKVTGAQQRADSHVTANEKVHELRTSAAKTEHELKTATAKAEAEAVEKAAAAKVNAAHAEGQIAVQTKQQLARAQYDSYIGHKKAEHAALPETGPLLTKADKLEDASVISNLHLNPTEYASKLQALGRELRESGQLVDARKFTKDLPVTKDGRDIRSIEHRLHEGQKVTNKEYERFVVARVKSHSLEQAREMKLLEGGLQEVHAPAVASSHTPQIIAGGGNGNALTATLGAIVNRIPTLPKPDIMQPGLRFVPGSPTPLTAGLVTTALIAGGVDIATDKDLVLGPTARLIDSATDLMAQDVTETDPNTKESRKIAVGWYRSMLMTNHILQDPARRASFAKGIEEGAADQGLKGLYLQAQKQPIQAQEVRSAQKDADANLKLATAREQAAEDQGLAIKQQADAAKEKALRDQQAQKEYRDSLDLKF